MATTRKPSRRKFGSIRRLDSGRFQARYRGPDGRMYTAPVTYPSVADADAYLATVQSDIVRSTWRAPRKVTETVGSYVSRWIAENGRVKVTTRALYENLHAANIQPYPLADLSLSDLTADAVRTWHATLRDDVAARVSARKRHSTATTRTGATTVAQTYRLLRAAMSTAVADDLIQRNPCQVDGADKSSTAERPVASRDDVAALAAAMPERYRHLILLAAWSGLRSGELFALRRRDLDLDPARPTVTVSERLYRVRGRNDFGTPKSTAGRRTVDLPGFLVPGLTAHLETFTGPDPDAFLFTTSGGKPVTTATLTPIWHRARAKAGRPDLRLHDLRHTGQTMAAEAGATDAYLRQRMGHSTSAASAWYAHVTDDHGRAVAERLSDLATDATVVPLRPRTRRTG